MRRKEEKKSGGLGEEYKKVRMRKEKGEESKECWKESSTPFSSACFQYSLLK